MSDAVHKGRLDGDWTEPDLSILDDRRGPVPALPLELVPEPWRKWTADAASATGTPADYVFQTVLAGLAGVGGAGVRVRVTTAWAEPLVLWQAMVGEPSAGKSTALAPMRQLLATIEQERRLHDASRREAHVEEARNSAKASPFVASQVVVADADLEAMVEIVSGNPRGVLRWRDVPTPWLGGDFATADGCAPWLEAWAAGAVSVGRQRKPRLDLASCAVGILDTMRPDRLKEALQEADEGLAARFLYVWPGPQPYRALSAKDIVHDEEALKRLRHLSHLARTPDDPCELRFDERGVKALDGVLACLHAERSRAEGLEAAWLGKGRSFIVRLAGAIELLGSVETPRGRPGAIGAEQVEAAAALWKDYFWPHARAVFDCAELCHHRKRVLRVARWLRDTSAQVVTREDIRRRALSMSATAEDTDLVLYRLSYLGFVRSDLDSRGARGRPANRWLVNPALASP